MEIGEKVKSALFSNAPNSRISKLGILDCFIRISATAKTDLVANFIELGHVETCSDLCYLLIKPNSDLSSQGRWMRSHSALCVIWMLSACSQSDLWVISG